MAMDDMRAAALIGLVVGAYTSQAICVFARLGVADVLADGPQPVEAIAERVGAREAALYRVLRALDNPGVVTELDGRNFALTSLGEILRSDVPESLRAWAALIGMPFWHRPWGDLHEAVRTGDVSFERVHGASFIEYLSDNPGDADAFTAGFSSMYTPRNIIGSFDLSECGTIVDIGGGDGGVLAGILSENPHLHGTLCDTQTATAGATEEFSRAGVADRCRVVDLDDIGSVPRGAEIYLLSGMIHPADDDEAIDLLRGCRAAMSDTARLLIAETVLPEGGRPSIGALMDLQMLVFTPGGRLRTEAELRSLLDQAGLRWVRTVSSSAVVSLVEAVPCSGTGRGDGRPGT